MSYMLQAKIILVDFNLAVSNPTTKLPNLIARQIFQLYSSNYIPYQAVLQNLGKD